MALQGEQHVPGTDVNAIDCCEDCTQCGKTVCVEMDEGELIITCNCNYCLCQCYPDNPTYPYGAAILKYRAEHGYPILCSGCGNRTDPDMCWCGDLKAHHVSLFGDHPFVPMGCDCMRYKASEENLTMPHTISDNERRANDHEQS